MTESVLRTFHNRAHTQVPGVVELTGPKVYWDSVLRVMHDFGCDMDIDHKSVFKRLTSFFITHIEEPQQLPCMGLGVLQVFSNNEMGGRLIFKAKDVQAERDNLGHAYYEHAFRSHALFWANVSITKKGRFRMLIGNCTAPLHLNILISHLQSAGRL